MNKQVLKTGLSGAFWCDPTGGKFEFKPAELGTMTMSKGGQTAWFDELFDGGLVIPAKGSNAAITLLVTGRPGTGKSTLCLELCYRLSISVHRLRSLYVTTEGHAPWLVEHAKEFGWRADSLLLDSYSHDGVSFQSLKTKQDLEDFHSAIARGGSNDSLSRSLKAVLNEVHASVFGPVQDPADADVSLATTDGKAIKLSEFDVLVFDNLNNFEVNKNDWFDLLKNCGSSGPRLVIVVLDSLHSTDGPSASWEYLSDVIIRLARDYREPGGYLIRTLEIIKSRYQRAALGRHQVKITQGRKDVGRKVPVSLRMRDHPYRDEGGIFIYPSMHFMLSRHKYSKPSAAEIRMPRIEPAFSGMEKLLSGGFHAGRCIAFTGGQGTHKSRLAYLQMLFTLMIDPESRAIVISLGDDEGSSLQNLTEIAGQFPALDVAHLAEKGRLEIAYFPPGFITPEEFVHRLQLSIARNRHGAEHATLLVVFDSLNLLSSHFPLCAQHKIFIPGIIELLQHEGVTSFFVSASSASEEEYGLLPLADPILDFRRESMPTEEFLRRIPEDYLRSELVPTVSEVSLVRMEVARFAGGISAGEHAYLALLAKSDEHRDPFPAGLHFSLVNGSFEPPQNKARNQRVD